MTFFRRILIYDVEQIIDVSGLKEGVYNISITTESGKLHKQFIKIN